MTWLKQNWKIVLGYWGGGLFSGPGISAILQKFVINDPPHWLVAIIYFLGFGIYALAICLGYKSSKLKIDFLKYMVHTHEEKRSPDGTIETKDYGRIDANSVKILDGLRDLNDMP